MTYRENMAALLRRENINLNQIESNVQQQIQNADLAKKETIKNIKSASDLLIGDRDTQFKQGLEGAEVQGKGVLPWWYGRHVRDKYKKGDEAFKKDHKDKLARLAAMQNQLENLRDIDRAHHDAKFNMLLNGAYYDDADRFAKLSPHSQVAYAKSKLNLYNETIESKLSLWMSKDGTELNVNGMEYTPSSVTGLPLAPLALKEHALNVGLEKIRSDNGINGFNPDFLELAGTTTKEEAAKKNLMNKYRSQFDIDSSYQTRLKEIKSFTEDGDYDFNHLLSVFKATKDNRGNLLGYEGAWNETMNLLKSMGISGNLPDEVIERIKNTIDPRTGLRYIDDPSKAARFLQLEADIENGIAWNATAALKEDENKRKLLELDFNNMKEKIHSQGKRMDERTLAMYTAQFQKFNGKGEPDFVKNYKSIQDRDDDDDKKSLINIYKRRGFITEADMWGMSSEVRRWAEQIVEGDANSGLLKKSNESGAARGVDLLGETGPGTVSDSIQTLINKALKDSGIDPKEYPMFVPLTNARAFWQEKYNSYRTVHDYSESAAASAALDDLKTLLETKDRGFLSNSNPENESVIFKKPLAPTDQFIEHRDTSVEIIQKGLLKNGDTRFLSTADGLLPIGNQPIKDGIKYLKGEGLLPKIYIDIADQFPGITADKLVRWQVKAAIDSNEKLDIKGIDLNSLIQDSQEPTVWDALDMEIHKQVATSLGYKSNVFSKCQAKACINDQLYKLRVGDTTELGTGEDPDKVTKKQEGKIIDSTTGDIQVPSGEGSPTKQAISGLEQGIELEETRAAEEKPLIALITDRMQSTIKDPENKGLSIEEIVENQIRESTSLPKDKELMQKYYGGTDRNAQLKYTIALMLNDAGALGTDTHPIVGETPTGLSNLFDSKGAINYGQFDSDQSFPVGDIDHEKASQLVNDLLSYSQDKTSVERFAPLTGNYQKDMELTWVKQKIENGEIELIPIIDGEEVDSAAVEEYLNTPLPKVRSGISFYMPESKQFSPKHEVKYRLVDLTQEPINELQSSAFTVPGSPYLATNLQQYSGQLIAMNVGHDPTIPVSLEKAESDFDKWNWVVDQARKSGAKYPELIAAQFMLESGRGVNVSGTHNYFGLKTTATDPESTWLETSEFKNGKWVKVMAPFKNFDSPEAAIQYLSKLWYKDFGAYKGANNGKDINAAIQVLIKGNYATDPKYAEKLLKIIQEFKKLKVKPTKIKAA